MRSFENLSFNFCYNSEKMEKMNKKCRKYPANEDFPMLNGANKKASTKWLLLRSKFNKIVTLIVLSLPDNCNFHDFPLLRHKKKDRNLK